MFSLTWFHLHQLKFPAVLTCDTWFDCHIFQLWKITISISPPESFTFKERNYREGEEKESHQGEPQGLVHQLSWKSFVCFLLRVKVDCTHWRQGCDCKNVFESKSTFVQMSSAKEEVESVVTIQQPGSWIEDKGSFNDLSKEWCSWI